ncbi:hypothetical protein DFA_06153 [Cavenderia fasciculata]|uniref:Ankyrin repeat-containing protein n=1 Tax=Cavenderia fasciculata TaxID=261658 RepID=F4PK91_CACFS|nr:uncharacterized protein DFA_06153 [Cavenderia fasciculata]EGG24015.1 hypothetical protein DFA_06153 [Cavenderia fasciculata]|eukprot:XP_004361866.1 hypothetical protein DFA_06153 [Cavenderia fasciculata]
MTSPLSSLAMSSGNGETINVAVPSSPPQHAFNDDNGSNSSNHGGGGGNHPPSSSLKEYTTGGGTNSGKKGGTISGQTATGTMTPTLVTGGINNFSMLVEAIKNDDKDYISEFCKMLNSDTPPLHPLPPLLQIGGGSSPSLTSTSGVVTTTPPTTSPTLQSAVPTLTTTTTTALSTSVQPTPPNILQRGGTTKTLKLDFRDSDGKSAMHYCIEYDALASLDLLLQSPLASDVNHRDKDDWTPLHYAALFDRIECALILIQHSSVNINALTNEGWTPLHVCAWRGHSDFANMLVEKNAKLSIKNKQGQTPLQLAHNSNHTQLAQDISEAILNRDDDLNQHHHHHHHHSTSPKPSTMINNNNNNGGLVNSPSFSEELSTLYQDVLSTLQRGEPVHHFEEGVNYNVIRDMNGATALHFSALNDMVDMITVLVEKHHMNVNLLDQSGRTPLHYASYAGKIDAMKSLIGHGSHVNYGIGSPLNDQPTSVNMITSKSKKEYGIAAIHEAAASGDAKAVSLLLSSNANINARSYYGTPLHYAASVGAADVVRYLLGHGADARLKNDQEKGADPSLANELAESPLHVASSHGLVDMAQVLIGRGANLEAKDRWGETPLHKAATSNNTRVLELLLGMGAKVDSDNLEGETPLHVSIRRGATECAISLITRATTRSSLDTTNKYGETPLHYACSSGSIELAMLLLEKGAKAHEQDSQGDIPLMVALRKGSTEIALALVRWGVQGGQLHPSSSTTGLVASVPLSQSMDKSVEGGSTTTTGTTTGSSFFREDIGNSPFITPMLQTNNYYERALHAAALSGYSDCVLALLGVGADINDAECFGNTPLHGAAYSGNSDLVDMMITMGADVHRTNKDQVTPLHVAALSGHPRVVDLLVARNANCAKCDRNGNTPLHCAALAGDVNSINLMLSTNQLSIDIKNANQWTPLHMAASAGHLNCTRFLINNGANPNVKDISGDIPYDTAMSNEYLNQLEIVLASGSPRRVEYLGKLGLKFKVVTSNFAEDLDKSLYKTPSDYACANATIKAREVYNQLMKQYNDNDNNNNNNGEKKKPNIVIGADSIVVLGDTILEKPKDRDHAIEMLSNLSGKKHKGISILTRKQGDNNNNNNNEQEQPTVESTFYEETTVEFDQIDQASIAYYVDHYRPFDKAGSYGIQEIAAASFIRSIQGDFYNVTGMPIHKISKHLLELYNNKLI